MDKEEGQEDRDTEAEEFLEGMPWWWEPPRERQELTYNEQNSKGQMTNDGPAASLQAPTFLACLDVVCGSGPPGQGTVSCGNPSSQRNKIPRMILNTPGNSQTQLPTAKAPVLSCTYSHCKYPAPAQSICFWLRFPSVSS